MACGFYGFVQKYEFVTKCCVCVGNAVLLHPGDRGCALHEREPCRPSGRGSRIPVSKKPPGKPGGQKEKQGGLSAGIPARLRRLGRCRKAASCRGKDAKARERLNPRPLRRPEGRPVWDRARPKGLCRVRCRSRKPPRRLPPTGGRRRNWPPP